MSECTQPELWATSPSSDATEEEVARYLAHVDQCSFHTALEHAKERSVRSITAFTTGSVAEDLDTRVRRNVFIRHLAIRIDGVERTVLDLLQENNVTINVPDGSLVGVWHKAHDEDIYLTSYVLHSHEKKNSKTVLEDGQTISFAIVPEGDSRAKVTVTYAESKWSRALRLWLARVEYELGFRGGQIRWSTALKLAGVIGLLAGLILLPLFFRRTSSPIERVEVPREIPSPSPSASNEVITKDDNVRPTPPNSNTRPPVHTSLATVKRVYVAEAGGEYNQLLRAELIAELKQSGRFTVVTRAEDADAVLETESTRGPNVRMQLVNRVGRSLWFRTQSTNDESGAGAKDAAARIVRALTDEALQK